jgi:2-methylisocitrate lyase-like PEP mutase family enzyme
MSRFYRADVASVLTVMATGTSDSRPRTPETECGAEASAFTPGAAAKIVAVMASHTFGHDDVRRLMEEKDAVGIYIEDSLGSARGPQYDIDTAAARVSAARTVAEASGIPLVINARVDTLAGGGSWDEAVTRANAYLDAGADVIFFLGLNDEDKVARAIEQVQGRVSVIGGVGAVPLRRLAELGVSRVSLTALGDYPEDLRFTCAL